MADYDLPRLPDLLARLDQEAAAPLYSHDDLVELHECCAESATAIRALMAAVETLSTEPQMWAEKRDAAAAAEREACAKVCEDTERKYRSDGWLTPGEVVDMCIIAIRARGAE